MNGAGLAVFPSFLVAEQLATGRLVQVMPEFRVSPLEVSLLHPFPQGAPRSVSAFIEYAIELWKQDGLLED